MHSLFLIKIINLFLFLKFKIISKIAESSLESNENTRIWRIFINSSDAPFPKFDQPTFLIF